MTKPLLMARLVGTQQDMGAQHGRLVAAHRYMHVLAAHVDKRRAWIQYSQALHGIPPDQVAHITQSRRPGRVMGNASLSSGKQSSPQCAADRDQSQSSMQAIELNAQCAEGSVSHAAGSHRVSRYSTRFMLRVWRHSPLQASIERTSTMQLRCIAATAHVKR